MQSRPRLEATWSLVKIVQGFGSLHWTLEKSLLEWLGSREGGDTGASAALCNYCGCCCIVTIFDRLWHRWIWPQRRTKSRASQSQGPRAAVSVWQTERETQSWLEPLVSQGWRWKGSENLNKDGSHQLDCTFVIFKYQRIQRKLRCLPEVLWVTGLLTAFSPFDSSTCAHDQESVSVLHLDTNCAVVMSQCMLPAACCFHHLLFSFSPSLVS